MLALFRFLVCVIGGGFITLAAIRHFRGNAKGIWTILDPQDPADFRKRYGDRPPY